MNDKEFRKLLEETPPDDTGEVSFDSADYGMGVNAPVPAGENSQGIVSKAEFDRLMAETAPDDSEDEVSKSFLQRAGDVAMEGVAGVNRAGAGVLDLATLGFRNGLANPWIEGVINPALEASGSETRVPKIPSFSEAMTEQAGAFDDSMAGRFAGQIGEFAGGGVAGAGALAAAGRKVLNPANIQSAQNVGSNVVRMAADDSLKVAAGVPAVSAVAGQTAREFGADDNVAALLEIGGGVGAGYRYAKNEDALAGLALEKNVDITPEQLKSRGTKLFDELKEGPNRIELSPTETKELKKNIEVALSDGVMDANKIGKSKGQGARRSVDKIFKDFGITKKSKGKTLDFNQLQYLRKELKDAANDRTEAGTATTSARIASKGLKTVEDAITNYSAKRDDGTKELLGEANDVWSRYLNASSTKDSIDYVKDKSKKDAARLYASEWDNVIDVFHGRAKGVKVPNDLKEAFKEARDDTNAIGVADKIKRIGQVLVAKARWGAFSNANEASQKEIAKLAMTMGGVGMAAKAAKERANVIADDIAFDLYRKISQGRYSRRVNGSDAHAKAITKAYVKNTPPNERNPETLAALFIDNRVPVESINLNKTSPLQGQAALLAAYAQGEVNSALDSDQDQTSPVGELQP